MNIRRRRPFSCFSCFSSFWSMIVTLECVVVAWMTMMERFVGAQEVPTIQLIPFHDSPTVIANSIQYDTTDYDVALRTRRNSTVTSFRQNVCSRHKLQARGEVPLRDALNGLHLRPIIRVNEFFRLDENGAIDENDPGLVAVLLDELGRRAGFTWRDSFAIAHRPAGNFTFTELLVWGATHYDIFCSWWDFTLERLQEGVVFPEAWNEGNYILVGGKDLGKREEGEGVDIWNWLAPFAPEVWWLITFTIFASGALFWVVDYFDQTPEERQLRKERAEEHGLRTLAFTPCYLSFLTFTQHYLFVPKSHATRLLCVSLAFWSLLVSATYTANLASFFVVNAKPRFEVESIEDAIQASYVICVFKGSAIDTYVSERFPTAFLLRKDTERDAYLAVQQGKCSLIATQYSTWRQLEGDRSVNGNCNLEWTGRIIKYVPAGFANLADAGTLCTSLIRDVINLHLVEMKSDGFLDAKWDEHLRRSQEIDCDLMLAKDELNGDGDSARLGVKELAGTFLVHWLTSLFAVLVAIGSHVFERYKDYACFHFKKFVPKSQRIQLQQNEIEQMDCRRSNESDSIDIDTLNDHRRHQHHSFSQTRRASNHSSKSSGIDFSEFVGDPETWNALALDPFARSSVSSKPSPRNRPSTKSSMRANRLYRIDSQSSIEEKRQERYPTTRTHDELSDDAAAASSTMAAAAALEATRTMVMIHDMTECQHELQQAQQEQSKQIKAILGLVQNLHKQLNNGKDVAWDDDSEQWFDVN